MSTQKYAPEKDQEGNTLQLTDAEKDTLGEIGNICMGVSATTLSTLLGKRVTITTPRVSICSDSQCYEEYEKPVVATEVSYIEGIEGNSVFLIKKDDALLITSLLMGSDTADQAELNELYLSAISEVMNQMVGSASTALADLLHVSINISPPMVKEIALDDGHISQLSQDDVRIKISFRMEIEGLLVSNIMQIMPYAFGKNLAGSLTEPETAPKHTDKQVFVDAPKPVHEADAPLRGSGSTMPERNNERMQLKAVKYQSFNDTKPKSYATGTIDARNNIDLIMDVPLQVTVVLGKSKKSIKEILDLNMGSVIVLDRLAGEAVDVLVNGKLFARGEVVVIDDNYGVRITEITAYGQTLDTAAVMNNI